MQDLGTLPGGTFGYALGVNDEGVVGGYSDTALSGGQGRASLWTAGDGMRDLGTLPGGIWTVAFYKVHKGLIYKPRVHAVTSGMSPQNSGTVPYPPGKKRLLLDKQR